MFLFVPFFLLQAGLLGCEAVLSSMALMQASSMAAPPKKMMAPLGHGPPPREGPDRGPQSHMILPSGMSCPPLVRTHFRNLGWKRGYAINKLYPLSTELVRNKHFSQVQIIKNLVSFFFHLYFIFLKVNYFMFCCKVNKVVVILTKPFKSMVACSL